MGKGRRESSSVPRGLTWIGHIRPWVELNNYALKSVAIPGKPDAWKAGTSGLGGGSWCRWLLSTPGSLPHLQVLPVMGGARGRRVANLGHSRRQGVMEYDASLRPLEYPTDEVP